MTDTPTNELFEEVRGPLVLGSWLSSIKALSAIESRMKEQTALIETLAGYVEQDKICSYDRKRDTECDCGLSEALAAIEKRRSGR